MTRFFLVAFLTTVCLLARAGAQDTSLPSAESLQATIDSLAGDENAAERATFVEALAAVRSAEEQRNRAEGFAADIALVPQLLPGLQEELEQPREAPKLEVPEGAPLETIETLKVDAKATLATATTEVATIEANRLFRDTRAAALPQEIAEAREQLREAKEARAALIEGAASDAEVILARASVESRQARLDALEVEQRAYSVQEPLLTAQLDRAKRREATAREVAKFLAGQLEAARLRDGEQAAATVGEQIESAVATFPSLAEIAKKTSRLTALRAGQEGLPTRIATASEALQRDKRKLAEIRRQFEASTRRIDAGGLTEGMAATLRRDFEELPGPRLLAARARARAKDLSWGQLERIKLEEQPPGDPVQAAQAWLEGLPAEERTPELRDTAEQLFLSLRTAHADASDDLRDHNTIFYDHRRVADDLERTASEYRIYIEEHILWVRSSEDHLLATTLRVPMDLAGVVKAADLTAIGAGLVASMSAAPARFGVLLILLLALVLGRRTLRRKRAEFGQLVRSYRTDRYVYTVRALVQTVLLALPLPLAAWGLGWLLESSPVVLASDFGSALRQIAGMWWVLRTLRGLLIDKGVGSAHFRWRQADVAAVRRELRWFEPISVGLGTLVSGLDGASNADWSHSIGRLAFIVWMVASAYFLHRMLRAESPLWRGGDEDEGTSLMGRTRGVWARLVVAAPLLLAVLAALGYYYTAIQFELRLRASIGFMLLLVIVNALLLRWLFITRRQLAVNRAVEAKARRERAEAKKGHPEPEAAVDAEHVDIPAMDAQTRQLFKSSLTLASVLGLYLIWANVLPALQRLDNVQILPRLAIVSQETSAENAPPSVASRPPGPATDSASTGQPEPSPAGSDADVAAATPAAPTPMGPSGFAPEGTKAEPTPGAEGLPETLTLGDVLLALIFVALTSVAARNLPALLELALLQRLPLDSGSRYAITTVVRYLILIAGVSAVSGALGIGWKKIQWLAAALTFGLAFGLQEIFANFVSGLIILIERPIRVGDIVTAGGIEGRITQLRMRATTLLDYDRREFLIPNKEFITGSVINWTLSDPITRVVFPVGIAYGSDTDKARRLLLQVARESKLVLDDPKPSALFRRFGDSTLDFELRVFLGNRDQWPLLIDEIHTAIDAAFRKADIEIAFPQRDVHVRSIVRDGSPSTST